MYMLLCNHIWNAPIYHARPPLLRGDFFRSLKSGSTVLPSHGSTCSSSLSSLWSCFFMPSWNQPGHDIFKLLGKCLDISCQQVIGITATMTCITFDPCSFYHQIMVCCSFHEMWACSAPSAKYLDGHSLKICAFSLHICGHLEVHLDELGLGDGKHTEESYTEEQKARIANEAEDRAGLWRNLDICIDPLDPEKHTWSDHILNIVLMVVSVRDSPTPKWFFAYSPILSHFVAHLYEYFMCLSKF